MNLWKQKYFSWGLISLLIAAFIFIPLLFVLEGLAHGNNENVQHIQRYLLADLFYTTIRMIIGVAFVAVLLGLPAAYFVATFKFPLRNFLRKANILPIAIPTYIMAFAYASIFSVTGTFYYIGELFFTREELYAWNIDVLTEGWLMIFLGFALYPYVYSASLVSFSIKNKSLEEAAASLGAKPWKRFWRISFPIVLPAALGGMALVAMEVINDYGAMSYFNVNTITAGIFQAKQMDFSSSVFISALTFIIIVSFFTVYYLIKSYKKVQQSTSSTNYDLIKLNKSQGIIISFVVFLPFFFGFILPVLELVYLASSRIDILFSSEFFTIAFNSIQLAIIPALFVVLLSLILLYNQYLNKGFLSRLVAAVSNVGYGIPGAIIAVAVMAFVIIVDNSDKTTYHFLIDSFILLIFAYIIRFMAVGYNTLEGGFNQIAYSLPDTARSSGRGTFYTLIKVYLPLLKGALLTTLAIVVVDILKELPITLLLQRFNFNTLATVAYEKAKVTESVRDAAPYALLLIFVGTLAVLFLVSSGRNKVKNDSTFR